MTDIDGLLLDIDGVLLVSWNTIEGAVDAVATIESSGLPLRFVTNTTSISRLEIARRLDNAGIPVAVDEIFSAPAATAAWIRSHRPDASCYLINSGDLGDDLDGLDLVDETAPADLVVLGGAGPEFSYTQMNHALQLLLDGADLVGMHRNWYWRTDDGYSLDTGAYLAALEGASRTDATVLGKPSADFFLSATESLGLPPERVVMVGDDVENDVLAAQAVGVQGVLVRTGKFRDAALAEAHERPSHILDSIADVPAWLGLT